MADGLTLTNAQVLLALRALQQIGGRAVPNVKAVYAFMKAERKFGEVAKDIDNTRLALCEQYAYKNEDGTARHKQVVNDLGQEADGFDLADEDGFRTAYNTLLAETVTVEGVRAVTVDELSGASFSKDELSGLGPLVTE